MFKNDDEISNVQHVPFDFNSHKRSSIAPLVKAMPKKVNRKRLVPYEKLVMYFEYMAGKGDSPVSTTITIGNKYYGGMSYKEQYPHMVRAIRQHLPRLSKHKYLYVFEQQDNGQLHAHGIELNTYFVHFVNSFCKFGRRNRSQESFQPTHSVSEYLTYMSKDVSMMYNQGINYITNVSKYDIDDLFLKLYIDLPQN